MPLADVTYHCGCNACACVAEVSVAGAVCGACSNGHHHNMINE